MFNQLFRARELSALQASGIVASAASESRVVGRKLLVVFYHALTVMGVTALCVLALMFFKPDFADRVIALSPFMEKASDVQEHELSKLTSLTDRQAVVASDTAGNPVVRAAEKRSAGDQEQRWVTNWLAKRYRVARDAANMLVSETYMAASEIKIDPLLILAVMAVESRFNPFAESPVGAQGLMQVMSKVHKDKFEDHGGVKAALNPVANIRVGAQILKDYVERGGSIEAGLKGYVGAATHDTDYGYGAKVMAEYRHLKEVASGKRVPVKVTTASAAQRKSRTAQQSGDQQVSVPAAPAEPATLAIAEDELKQL